MPVCCRSPQLYLWMQLLMQLRGQQVSVFLIFSLPIDQPCVTPCHLLYCLRASLRMQAMRHRADAGIWQMVLLHGQPVCFLSVPVFTITVTGGCKPQPEQIHIMTTAAIHPHRTSQTDDQRIAGIRMIPPAEHLIRFFPIAGTAAEQLITDTRKNIHNIIHQQDNRLLVVMGPCSIHDTEAALEYAKKLMAARQRYAGELEILMRVYFEKPRTTVGWKGLINDPYLDGSFRIDEGLRMARQLLLQINQMGLPAGSEFLDVISPQYIGDLISWGAIGARTTESQIHRELASGLSAPIGFKNGTDGNIKIATDAIQSASNPHHFLSVSKAGNVAIVNTNGNADCHVILRGGKEPNYEPEFVNDAAEKLQEKGLPATVMVDCSHGNSSKQHKRQIDVAQSIAAQIKSGSRAIFGVMVESHLNEGNQSFKPGKDDPKTLEYGRSITDACLHWDDSEAVLEILAEAVRSRG